MQRYYLDVQNNHIHYVNSYIRKLEIFSFIGLSISMISLVVGIVLGIINFINIDLFYELLSLYGISAGISGSLLHYRFINNIGRYDIVGRNLIQIPVISINNNIIFKNKLIKNYIIDINHICSMEKNFFSVKFEMKDGRKFYTIPKYIIDIKEKN